MLAQLLQNQIKMVYTDFIWSNNQIIQRMQSQNELLKKQLKNILDCVTLVNKKYKNQINSVFQSNFANDAQSFTHPTVPFSNQQLNLNPNDYKKNQLNSIRKQSPKQNKDRQKQWNQQIQQNQSSCQTQNIQNIQQKIQKYDLKALQEKNQLIQKKKKERMQQKRIQHQKKLLNMTNLQKKSLNRKEYRMICQFFKVLFPQIITFDSIQQATISKKQLLTIYVHWRLQTFTQQKEIFNISSIQVIIANYIRLHFKDKVKQGKHKYHGLKFIAYNKITKYFTLNIDQYKIPKYGNYNNKNWIQRYKKNYLQQSSQQILKIQELNNQIKKKKAKFEGTDLQLKSQNQQQQNYVYSQ